jgi:hypothetical protein
MSYNNIHHTLYRGDLSPSKAYSHLFLDVDAIPYKGFFIVEAPNDEDQYHELLNSLMRRYHHGLLEYACYVKDDKYHFVGLQDVGIGWGATDKSGNHIVPQFRKGDKITFHGAKGVVNKVRRDRGVYTYDVSYESHDGHVSGFQTFVGNKYNEIRLS